MENIDPDLLLNYYFKDGYFFHVPARFLEDRDFGFASDYDEALEFSQEISESLEVPDL